MSLENAKKKLNTCDRDTYVKVYNELSKNMFTQCEIPTVADFANAFGKKNGKTKGALAKITHISDFTDNTDDIVKSSNRRASNYTESESSKFMNSVISANVTSITQSGFFYKKLSSSTDNMRIDMKYDDCHSSGQKMTLPVDKDTYDYKIRDHFVMELDDYTENFDDFCEKTKNLKEIHVRSFITCTRSHNHRTFCKKCAGLYRREHGSTFIPKYIGMYSTLMITEHATQASLDSMNKGSTTSINVLLEQKIEPKGTKTYEDVKKVINDIIDKIGNVGVDSRFYEIALLSRMYKQDNGTYKAAPLVTSFLRQGDKFGAFIYKPTKLNFLKMLSADKITGTSLKTQIALDDYKL